MGFGFILGFQFRRFRFHIRVSVSRRLLRNCFLSPACWVAGRHLWSSAVATGGFGNLDTMLQETSHKWMAHAPYAATSKVASGLGRRMTRHVRLNQALEVTLNLRSAPTAQKTSLRRSGCPVGLRREVQVRFVGRGLVIHEPCGDSGLNCWRCWHSLSAGGRPKSCRGQCKAPEVSGWAGCLKLKPNLTLKLKPKSTMKLKPVVLKPELILETETGLLLLLWLSVGVAGAAACRGVPRTADARAFGVRGQREEGRGRVHARNPSQ